MKILFKIISVFLYFNFVSPVQMYYIYDDNPNIGFVSLDNGVDTYMRAGYGAGKAGKKQFTGGYSNSKYLKSNSDHVIDSHFKVMKTPSRYPISSALDTAGRIRNEAGQNKAQRIVDVYRNTEAPNHSQQQKTQLQKMAGQQDKQIAQIPNKTPARSDYGGKPNEAGSHTQPLNNQQVSPGRSKVITDYNNEVNQRNQDQGRNQRNNDAGRSQNTQDSAFDSKSNYVQSKVNQAQMSPEPLKTMHNNHQLTLSEKRLRMPTSMVMDKTLHKTTGIAHDHNMQVMARVLDNMTQKIVDRRHKKGEYVNRDSDKHLDILYEKSKRSVVADNMRKYIGKDKIGKELRNQRLSTALARIGSREEGFELNDTPYAVFYRMNPEALDQQDGFMIMKTKEELGSGDTGLEGNNENMTTKQNPIKNGGTSRQREKLKNFSNYRNH